MMTYDTWKAHEGNPRVNDETPTEDDGPPEFWEGKTGKWFITHEPETATSPEVGWSFQHEDFDVFAGAGGSRDNRVGEAASWHECVERIKEIENDDEDLDMSGDPILPDDQMTDRQRAADFHRDEEAADRTRSWDDGWYESEADDA